MRLVYPSLNLDVCLSFAQATVIVLEDKASFLHFVFDLWNQSMGKDGALILSDKDKTLRLDKNAEVVTNPFEINFNDKKILSKIYLELEELCNERYVEEVSTIQSNIVSLFDMLEQGINYPVHFNMDIELRDLFKLQDVKVEENEEGFLDKLISYIKLLHQACAKNVFIFVNLKTFFSNDMMAELYKACAYEEVIVVDIESHDFGRATEAEKRFIIDQDLCLIEV